MRFNELVESTSKTPIAIAQLISRDCAPFIAALNGDLMQYKLSRGIEQTAEFGIKKARLVGRKPTSTNPEHHAIWNNWFTENFGHPYRNGIFVTGDQLVASTYGTMYHIFPIGQYSILWNPKVGDLFNTMNGAMTKFWSNNPGQEWDKPDIDNALDQLKSDYRQDGIKEAIASEKEIMLWCEQYYYLSEDAYSKLLVGMKQL